MPNKVYLLIEERNIDRGEFDDLEIRCFETKAAAVKYRNAQRNLLEQHDRWDNDRRRFVREALDNLGVQAPEYDYKANALKRKEYGLEYKKWQDEHEKLEVRFTEINPKPPEPDTWNEYVILERKIEIAEPEAPNE